MEQSGQLHAPAFCDHQTRNRMRLPAGLPVVVVEIKLSDKVKMARRVFRTYVILSINQSLSELSRHFTNISKLLNLQLQTNFKKLSNCSNKLTAWERVLLYKLTVAQLGTKLSAFYGTRRFNNVTSARLILHASINPILRVVSSFHDFQTKFDMRF
jgi:hypothetical protein